MEMTVPKLSTVLVLLSFGYAYCQNQACSNGDLRLVNPRNSTRTACVSEQPTELQLCVDERWCSVCARDWNRRLSRTTCRELGYRRGYQLPMGQNAEEIPAVRLDCSDQENLSECSISRKGSCPLRNIIHLNCTNDDASTTQRCEEGDLRLTGGKMANQGNLEVCHLDVWGSVCNTIWSEANSNVTCKELGFTAGMDTENKASLRMIDECTSPIHLYNVTCSGEEDSIANCEQNNIAPFLSYNNQTCGIFLTCSSSRAACEDGDVDLYVLDPRAPEEGWLLICFKEEWRTLCDTEWDFLDSTVACRQLDYIGGFHFELPLAGTPKDEYTIHADNVRCTGNESRLLECQHSTEHNCIHARDVFLVCRESGDGCEDGDVRLVDGPSDREGRLEFCWNDIWGAVCNKDWIRRNTNVTCQQLGLYTGYEESMLLKPTENIPTVIEQTNCTGSEPQLADCAFQFTPAYNCLLHENDVVLTCLGEEELFDCEDGDLKVVEGRSSGEGLLKICHQKMYGTICGNNWDIDTDSVVACRQLGFNRSVTPQLAVGALGKGPIHFTNFMCNGTERSITECSFQPVELYSSTCDHSRDIYIACRDPIDGSSTSSLIVVAYTLIPVVLILAASVAIVAAIAFFLKCRSKDEDQQPRQDSSLVHHPRPTRPDLGGQLYRNAMYSKDLPIPERLMTMFPDGHYMMSESVMGHVYESIGDDDVVRVHYKGEYHQYSLIEKEVSPIDGSPGTVSTDPLTYDKLDESSKVMSPYNVLNRSERSTQEGPGRYKRLGLQVSQEDRGYNKLQRNRHEAKQLTEREDIDYEQIDFPENV